MDFETQYLEFQKNFPFWKPYFVSQNCKAKVVDFFCGCGGTSLGFAAIPDYFQIVCGVDINPKALSSFSHNFACETICKDIRDFSNEDLQSIENLIGKSNDGPLVVVGCAPCQGFSAHRKKDKEKPEDQRNSLIKTFAELAIRINPDYIVMENVQEVLNGKYRNHYEEAKSIFLTAGYKVTQRIYNAASFGVPQARIRAIIVASKCQFTMPAEVFKHGQFKTVRDAIGNLPKANNPTGNDSYHFSAKHKKSTIDVIAQVPKNGGSRPPHVGPPCLDKVKGFSDVYGRLSWDKPAVTITKTARNPACGRYCHPEEDRGLTLREVARLQGFPDSFIFEGGSSDRYEQVGEAVPPQLSMAIATQIFLQEKEKKTDGV